MLYRHVLDKISDKFRGPSTPRLSEPTAVFWPFFKSYLSHKFDRPETISDRVKMNLAGHRV